MPRSVRSRSHKGASVEPAGAATGGWMDRPKLMIASKNYGSWSLRGWLLCKLAGLDFDEKVVPAGDTFPRAELLLLSPSFLVPSLTTGAIKVWDTLAIAEYLNELNPEAGRLP